MPSLLLDPARTLSFFTSTVDMAASFRACQKQPTLPWLGVRFF